MTVVADSFPGTSFPVWRVVGERIKSLSPYNRCPCAGVGAAVHIRRIDCRVIRHAGT